MKILPILVCASGLLLTGCVHSAFYAYEGEPQIHAGSGAFCRTVENFPIYMGEPNKTFLVLGEIQVTGDARANFDFMAIDEAKAHHADALMIVANESQYAGSVGSSFSSYSAFGSTVIGSTTGSSRAVYRGDSLYIAIQFLTPNTALQTGLQGVLDWLKAHPAGGSFGTNDFTPERVATAIIKTQFAIDYMQMHTNQIWTAERLLTIYTNSLTAHEP